MSNYPWPSIHHARGKVTHCGHNFGRYSWAYGAAASRYWKYLHDILPPENRQWYFYPESFDMGGEL